MKLSGMQQRHLQAMQKLLYRKLDYKMLEKQHINSYKCPDDYHSGCGYGERFYSTINECGWGKEYSGPNHLAHTGIYDAVRHKTKYPHCLMVKEEVSV